MGYYITSGHQLLFWVVAGCVIPVSGAGSGAGRVIQRALNDNLGIDLVIDGIIGDKTIAAINSIDDVSQFMEVLKQKRIEYLKRTPNWITARNGWIKRTDSY